MQSTLDTLHSHPTSAPESPRARRIHPLGLAPLLLGVALATGCTIHRVGTVTAETRAAIPPTSIRVNPKLADGNRPAGMLWLKIMPILRNTPEARTALAKECAAQLGYDTLSGFLNLEEVYAKWPLGTVLLSDSAHPAPANRAKFTVCMPLPGGTGEKMSDAAARYLRQEIQYLAAEKGYYVYFSDVPGITLASVQEGSFNPAVLADPIGALPDFVMIGELTKVKRSGTQLLIATQDLEFTLTLVDVDTRKPVWNTSIKGGMAEGMIFPGLTLSLVTSRDEDLREATRNTCLEALKTLPVIPQHRKLK